jgi:hypothetical protein
VGWDGGGAEARVRAGGCLINQVLEGGRKAGCDAQLY